MPMQEPVSSRLDGSSHTMLRIFIAFLLVCSFAALTSCSRSNRHTEATAQYQLTQVDTLILEWEKKQSRLPPTGQEGLRVIGDLIPNHSAIGLLLQDPWGHPLVYRIPSDHNGCRFDLYSVGPNGIDDHGQGDDIVLDFTGHRPGCSK
jgi:Type II secretion system (T2SS), protein G